MFNQTRTAIIAIALIIPLSTIAIWNSSQSMEFTETSLENQKIVIFASFYPLYEFTKVVGQDNVEVSLLVPPGVEPHEWEPSIKDIQRMQESDLIIINGIGFENWVDDIHKINSNLTVVDTSYGITPIKASPESNLEILTDVYKEFRTDPHIWLNPIMVRVQIQNIANALIKFDPENANYYQKNADSYKLKLEFLDKKIKDELSKCNKKDFFAFHNAFSYFALEYGLNQHTVLKSIDTLEDPGPKDIQEVVDLAKTLETSVIFTEEFTNQKLSQVIADETDSKLLVISPLEFGDENRTYLERMEQNLANLKEALCN